MTSPLLRPAWAAAAIALAILAAYATSWRGVFVLDDSEAVVGNTSIRQWETAWQPPRDGSPVTGRPLTNASYALSYAISGLKPAGYHAVSLAIHLAAALALWGVLRRTRLGEGGALAATLVWAVHPLGTAAVTYLGQRGEALAALCALLTLLCFQRGWWAASVAACAAGMAAKETMVVAPVLVWLYDWTFQGDAWRRRLGYYGALAATWVILVALVAGAGSRAGTAGFGSGIAWWRYALGQPRAVMHYLAVAVWPHGLAGDYGRALPGTVAGRWVSLLVVAAVVVSVVVAVRRRSAAGFVGAAFLLLLAPSSSVVPIASEVMADHRMYLPLAVLIAGLVAVAFRIRPPKRCLAALRQPDTFPTSPAKGDPRARQATSIATTALLALGLLTAARNRVYASERTFWEDVARAVPSNAGAWNNLGNLSLDAGNPAEAEADYRRALAIAPEYADAQANLGRVCLQEGRKEEAETRYRAALRFRPKEPTWLNNLGVLLAQRGRWVEAKGEFERAVAAKADYGEARRNLERVNAILAGRAP